MEVDNEETEFKNNLYNSKDDSRFSKYFKNYQKLISMKEKQVTEIEQLRKKQRNEQFDLHRIYEDDFNISNPIAKSIKKKFNTNIRFANLLMLSDIFKTIPKNLHQKYIVSYCPKGERVIIVSQHVRI